MELFGSKLDKLQDSLRRSPREKALHDVLGRLEPALEGAMNKAKETTARAALELIQDQYYSSYVRPSQVELAAGARQVLQQEFKRLPADHVIVIERFTIAALEAEQLEWLSSVIDMDSAIEVLPEDTRALSLVRAYSNHRVVITASYFVAMEEETNTSARFSSVKAYVACMDLLVASGNQVGHDVQRQRRILQSFLMYLDFDACGDANYRTARQHAMPQGFFAGNKKNVLVVSQNLKMGYGELLYLRERLGEAKTGKLLVAHGFQASSPLEPTWKCPGAPRVAEIQAHACTNHQDDDRYAVMVGGDQPEHLLRGWFCCQRCHRKMERRELALLQQAETENELPKGGMKRLQLLQGRKDVHRENENLDRVSRIESEGLAAVQKDELDRNRAFQSRITAMHEADPAAHSNDLQRHLELEQNRLKAGGKKKKRGVYRKIIANKMYPPFFVNMLTQATRIWARKYAQQCVYWNHLVELFDHLLVREQDELGGISFAADNKPKYLDKAYRMAAGRVLVQCETVKANWKYPKYDPKCTTSEKTKDLIPEVVRLLYEEMKSDNNHGKENTLVH